MLGLLLCFSSRPIISHMIYLRSKRLAACKLSLMTAMTGAVEARLDDAASRRQRGKWDTSDLVFGGRIVRQRAPRAVAKPAGSITAALHRSVLPERVRPRRHSTLRQLCLRWPLMGSRRFRVRGSLLAIGSLQSRVEAKSLLPEQPRC